MCAKIHGKRGEETPCDECTPPLLPENADAVTIWSIVQDQVILAPMGGPVAVNQLAIHEAMALYGVQDKRDCFKKVLLLSREFIGESNGN